MLLTAPAAALLLAAAPLPPQTPPEKVEVTATRVPEDPTGIPAAVDVITAEELRALGATDLRSALALIAGVDIAPGGDGGPASSVPAFWGLREFDAFLLVVDGVPLGGAFNPDLPVLPMDDIDRIEVVRGPAPVFYGATSFVGVVQVVRNAPGTGKPSLRASGGSYGSGSLSYRTPVPAVGKIRTSVSADLERRGYRDDRTGFDRARVHAGAAAPALGGDLRVDLDLSWLAQDPASPHPREGGSLSSAVPLDANHNPDGSRIDGRRATLTGRYDRKAGSLEWAGTASVSTAAQSVLRGFLTEVVDTDPNAVGFRQALDLTDVYLDGHVVAPLTSTTRLIVGIDHLQGKGEMHGGDFDYFVPLDGSTPPAGSDLPPAADVFIRDRRAFSGAYANVEWRPADAWRVDAGVRLNRTSEKRDVSAIEFSVGDLEESSDRRTTTRGSGSLGVVWRALDGSATKLHLFGAVRSTFKPAAMDFGLDADPEILEPEDATTWEAGAKAGFGKGSVTLSLFRMDFDNLVVSQSVNGLPALENAGSERFQGVEVRGEWTFAGILHAIAAYSLHDARFRDYLTQFDGNPAQIAGHRLEMSPRDMASIGLVVAPKGAWHGSVTAQWVGARWLNKRNTALAPDYATWSAGVGWRRGDWGVRFDGRNLNDSRAPVAESELGDAQYYRLPARTVSLALTWEPR